MLTSAIVWLGEVVNDLFMNMRQLRRWLRIWLISLGLVADQSWINYSLSLLEVKPIIILAEFHQIPGCPYAEMVSEVFEAWCMNHPIRVCQSQVHDDRFPSPTLRIKIEDYYVNFFGVTAIEEALKMFP
jgi:hypothetical protein